MDHLLEQKTNLNEIKMIQITPSIISEENGDLGTLQIYTN